MNMHIFHSRWTELPTWRRPGGETDRKMDMVARKKFSRTVGSVEAAASATWPQDLVLSRNMGDCGAAGLTGLDVDGLTSKLDCFLKMSASSFVSFFRGSLNFRRSRHVWKSSEEALLCLCRPPPPSGRFCTFLRMLPTILRVQSERVRGSAAPPAAHSSPSPRSGDFDFHRRCRDSSVSLRNGVFAPELNARL